MDAKQYLRIEGCLTLLNQSLSHCSTPLICGYTIMQAHFRKCPPARPKFTRGIVSLTKQLLLGLHYNQMNM